MIVLPSELIGEKNQLNLDTPWLLTVEFNFDGTYVRLVNNNEDVTIDGVAFTKFPFILEPIETNVGELAAAQLNFSNVSRALQAYIEQYNGGVDSTVTVRIFSANYLQFSKAALSWTFLIVGTSCNDTNITLRLGARNPLIQRFPMYRYIGRHCKWKWKSAECKAVSAETTCDRWHSTCEARNNEVNFGGYPGLGPGGLRLGY